MIFFISLRECGIQGPAVSDETFCKKVERISGFLGHLKYHQGVESPDFNNFHNSKQFETYVKYLRTERHCNPATIALHCQVCVNA